jgi:tetratricopeptide (TPR) repeat protein
VNNSLVQQTVGVDGELRFGMLETVREYADERLTESSEAAAIQTRQLAYFLELAETAEPELYGARQAAWLDRLDQEAANFRAVLAWALTAGAATDGLRLASALRTFWWVRGHAREGHAWLERLLPVVGSAMVAAGVHARALHGAAVLANAMGDYARAKTQLKQSVVLFEEAGDTLGIARAMISLGGTAYDEGDLEGAAALWEQSLALARQAGNLGEVARSLGNLGEAAYHLGNLGEAAARHQEALAFAREAGRTEVEASQLGNLANVARRRGDMAAAHRLQQQALVLQVAHGNRRQIAICLEHFAQIHATDRRAERAARLLGAAMALRHVIGAPQPAPERTDTERGVAAARAALGEPQWAAALQAGQTLLLEQAIAEALDEANCEQRV